MRSLGTRDCSEAGPGPPALGGRLPGHRVAAPLRAVSRLAWRTCSPAPTGPAHRAPPGRHRRPTAPPVGEEAEARAALLTARFLGTFSLPFLSQSLLSLPYLSREQRRPVLSVWVLASPSPLCPQHTPHDADPLLPRPTHGPLQLRSCRGPAPARVAMTTPGREGANGGAARPRSQPPPRRRSDALFCCPTWPAFPPRGPGAKELRASKATKFGRLEGVGGLG